MLEIDKKIATVRKEGNGITSVSIPFDKEFPLLKTNFDVETELIQVGGKQYSVDHIFTSDNGGWIVMFCYPYMDILRLAKIAQTYYDSLKAPSLAQGWEKYVVTDGETCMFVKSDYEPQEGEAVFYFCVRNRNTYCQLHKAYKI